MSGTLRCEPLTPVGPGTGPVNISALSLVWVPSSLSFFSGLTRRSPPPSDPVSKHACRRCATAQSGAKGILSTVPARYPTKRESPGRGAVKNSDQRAYCPPPPPSPRLTSGFTDLGKKEKAARLFPFRLGSRAVILQLPYATLMPGRPCSRSLFRVVAHHPRSHRPPERKLFGIDVQKEEKVTAASLLCVHPLPPRALD